MRAILSVADRIPGSVVLYQRAHELILFWDAKLFHSGSNLGTPWHLKKGLDHVLVGISHYRITIQPIPYLRVNIRLLGRNRHWW